MRIVEVVKSQIQALKMLKIEETAGIFKSTWDGFAGQVKTNNTSLVAGYAFPRTTIDTLVPLSKFSGHSRIEYQVVLQFKQQELLIAQTLAGHHRDTKVEEKCAHGHQKEPRKGGNFHCRRL
jgi:hypothetical protein